MDTIIAKEGKTVDTHSRLRQLDHFCTRAEAVHGHPFRTSALELGKHVQSCY